MSSSLITPLLTCKPVNAGQTVFTAQGANLNVNGFLFDISFTVPASYTGKWDFLKDWLVQISLRKGSGVGTQIALVSSVPVYSLLAYSDYVAGVSMESTTFTEGSIARISGYVDIGYFGMGSRDALDVQLSIGSPVPSAITGGVNFQCSSVYTVSQVNNISTYLAMKPTGADQPVYNALELFYVGGNTLVNDNAVVTDDIGVKTVNVESAIALSNAIGEFEFFTRFGRLWSDEYGVSQNISARVPATDTSASILIKCMSFQPDMLADNAIETASSRDALLAKISANDPKKYEYLKQLGIA